MVEVSFEINGKKVLPESMRDALDILYLNQVRKELTSRLWSLYCPRHDAEPVVTVKGRDLDTLEYEVSGCCSDLISEARKRIK